MKHLLAIFLLTIAALAPTTTTTSAAPAGPTFDAGTLFKMHHVSIAEITKTVSIGPNKLETNLGSGFVIDRIDSSSNSSSSSKSAADITGTITCRIATDNHVINPVSADALVHLNDNQYPFTVELRDEQNDLAVLRVERVKSEDCQPLTLTDQEIAVKAGDFVVKIGARNGKPDYISAVVETYFSRDKAPRLALLPGENSKRTMLSVIFKTTFTQSGDSGGPIMAADGTVVAIMDAEGHNMFGGTPAHHLLNDLRKLQASDQ